MSRPEWEEEVCIQYTGIEEYCKISIGYIKEENVKRQKEYRVGVY